MISSSLVFLPQADREKNILCSNLVAHARAPANPVHGHARIHEHTPTHFCENILYVYTCTLNRDKLRLGQQ